MRSTTPLFAFAISTLVASAGYTQSEWAASTDHAAASALEVSYMETAGPAPERDGNRARNRTRGEFSEGQVALIEAVIRHKRVQFIEGSGVIVTKILPDDNEGRPHQKWAFRLESGHEVLAVYNTDTGDRIPLKVGDTIDVGGELVFDRSGRALIHWLHADPKQRRPDGYVLHKGQRYGEFDEFRDLPPHIRQRALRDKQMREARELRENRIRHAL